MIAPGAVLVADAAGRSPGRVLAAVAIVAVCGGFLGGAAGAGAAWRTGRGR